MICPNCGKEISDNSKFCGACGAFVAVQPAPVPEQQPAPVTAEQQPMPVAAQPIPGAVPPPVNYMPNQNPGNIPPAGGRKKGKAGIVILILVLVVLLAGGAAGAFLFLNRPIHKISKALEENDLETVARFYPRLSNDEDRAEVSVKLLEYAESRKDAYLNEETDYETVQRELEEIASIDSQEDEEIEEMLELLGQLKASRDSYQEAEKYRAEGSYQMALAAYAEVIPEDTLYYDRAQEAMEAAKGELVQASIESARSYTESENYAQAQQVLEDALLVLPGNTDLLAAMDDIRTSQRDNIINTALQDAEAAVGEGRISDARAILEAALETYPDSIELQNAVAGLPSDGALAGTWRLDYDISQAVISELGEEFEDFQTPLVIPLMFELGEDGSFNIYISEEFPENYDAWEEDFLTYSIDLIYDTLEDMGISKEQAQEMIKEEYGYSLEDYFRKSIEEEIDDSMLEELMSLKETGRYEVQGDRLYITDESGEMDYDAYETFIVEGDTLTFLKPEGLDEEEFMPGLSYPLSFTRVTETD